MDILGDYNLVQIVTGPTRHDNVLDLIMTSNPTLASKVEWLPGLSDYDIVLAEVAIKPVQKSRNVGTLSTSTTKQNGPPFGQNLETTRQSFYLSIMGKLSNNSGQTLQTNLIN